MDDYQQVMELVSRVVDGVGVMIMVMGAALASFRFVRTRRVDFGAAYGGYRQDLARGILLGLEFLVAGDIIRTVAVAPTLENVAVLGMIVIIRTFLSLSLQLEIEGRLPWQREA